MYFPFFELQPLAPRPHSCCCCDLLSKCIFRSLNYNHRCRSDWKKPVVICFQNVFSVLWTTTQARMYAIASQLWFAFKMYFPFFELQQVFTIFPSWLSCDLLSKCIFRSLNYNWVNGLPLLSKLWFAFKMYFPFFELQRLSPFVLVNMCCDLLSKCIFRSLNYNASRSRSSSLSVVICFQNVFSVLWTTTFPAYHVTLIRLWFAFKMYFPFFELQLEEKNDILDTSCDLLSKCIFRSLNYNAQIDSGNRNQLWFAFKMYFPFFELQLQH